MELNKIYNEDCFITMDRMSIGMLSVILTSPFYNTNKKQGNNRTLSNTNPKGYSYLRYDEHVDNMTDEDNLGFTYDVLDRYIRTGEIEDKEVKKRIDTMHEKNLFKLQLMPSFQP